MPGTPRFAEHRRRIHILVVAVYLAYTIYEADYDMRRAGSYYQDLGVSLTASERDIKARFRRLAALYHPDKASPSGTTPEQAERINNYFVHLKVASETLLEPARRFAYDRFGPASVAWASKSKTIYDFIMKGLQDLVPYYLAAAGALYGFGLMGCLTWGRYERWLVLVSILVFELYCITRPTHPAVLTRFVNPVLAAVSRLLPHHREPYLPFQAIQLARKLSITTYIGFSQIGPMLGADTRSGQIVTPEDGNSLSTSKGGQDPALVAALDRLEMTAKSLDTDAARLLEMEMAPFMGDLAAMNNVRGKIKEWLIQNTIRNDPMVRDAMGRSLQRRRMDAPARARGTR